MTLFRGAIVTHSAKYSCFILEGIFPHYFLMASFRIIFALSLHFSRHSMEWSATGDPSSNTHSYSPNAKFRWLRVSESESKENCARVILARKVKVGVNLAATLLSTEFRAAGQNFANDQLMIFMVRLLPAAVDGCTREGLVFKLAGFMWLHPTPYPSVERDTWPVIDDSTICFREGCHVKANILTDLWRCNFSSQRSQDFIENWNHIDSKVSASSSLEICSLQSVL